MPRWLSPDGRAAWADVVALLKPQALLIPGDVFALTCLCQAWAELRIATQLLDADGRVLLRPIQTSKGEHLGDQQLPHPAVAIQQQAMLRIKTFAVEFRLTPASRAGMSPAADDDKEGKEPPGREQSLSAFLRTA